MSPNEADEVGLRVAAERRDAEMRIGRKKLRRGRMEIGEIATSAAGDEDFFAGARGAFEDGDAASTLPCFNSAHKASGTSAENYGIIVVSHFRFVRAARQR